MTSTRMKMTVAMMNLTRPRECHTPHKYKFPTSAQAIRHNQRVNGQRKQHHETVKRLTPYKCRCGYWHLTSRYT